MDTMRRPERQFGQNHQHGAGGEKRRSFIVDLFALKWSLLGRNLIRRP